MMPDLPCWLFEKKDLKNTPSFQGGIDADTEARYRREGGRFIINMRQNMGLPCVTMATGAVYFHRFYMFHSFRNIPRYVMACSCLYLAGKVEETPKKCEVIVDVARCLLNDREFAQFGQNPITSVIALEKILLKTIKFDLQIEHPYPFLLKYGKQIKGDKALLEQMIGKAWTFVNDSLCTALCLQWEPEIIAIAFIYLAGKILKSEVVDWHGRTARQKKWWDVFVEDMTTELLDDICHQLLDSYSNMPNTNLKQESPSTTPPLPLLVMQPPLPPPQKPKFKDKMSPSITYHPYLFARNPKHLQPPPPLPHTGDRNATNPIHSLKVDQSQVLRTKTRPNTQPTDVLPPQWPLPPVALAQPNLSYNYTHAPNELYGQYNNPPPPMPPGFQQPQCSQGFRPPEQFVQERDQRFIQPNYQESYQLPPPGQPYYSMPPPPPGQYIGQGYSETYPSEHQSEYPYGPPPISDASYQPQPPGYQPPPNQNYPLPAPYSHESESTMGQQHASPNFKVSRGRISGRTSQHWRM